MTPVEKLRAVDFSQEAYRGYLIRTNALNGAMWIEKDGQNIASVPPEKSWAHARSMIDQLILVDTLP